MKFFCAIVVYLVLACSSFVSGQSLQQDLSLVPSCAQTCIDNFQQSNGCDPNDYACLCSNQRGLLGGIAAGTVAGACLLSACGLANATATFSALTNVCALENSSSAVSAAPSVASPATPIVSIPTPIVSPPTPIVSPPPPIVSPPTFSVSLLTPSASSPSIGIGSSTSSISSISLITATSTITATSVISSKTVLPAEPSATSNQPTSLNSTLTGNRKAPNSITPGGRAGIAIGVLVFSILVVFGIMFILRKRSRQAHNGIYQGTGWSLFRHISSTPSLQTPPLQPKGKTGEIEVRHHLSFASTRLDGLENRPPVPRKDGESAKGVHVVVKEWKRGVERETENLPKIRQSLGIETRNLPNIRASLGSPTAISDFEVGMGKAVHLGQNKDQTVKILDPFTDGPQGPASFMSLRDSELPQTPKSFETSVPSSPTLSRLALFPLGNSSQISERQRSTDSLRFAASRPYSATLAEVLENETHPEPEPESEPFSAERPMETQLRVEEVQRPTVGDPLGQNPFSSIDANKSGKT